MAQAQLVANELRDLGAEDVELVVIRSHGDEAAPNHGFTDLSGKALFTQRIEEALIEGHIDAAVHSLKDLPAESLGGIELVAVPRREDPRDVLVSRHAASIHELPKSAVLATSSLRRKSQLLAVRPDLQVEPIRGNIETRISKLGALGYAGTVLAAAGIRRLRLTDVPATPIDPRDVLPAPGQGALAVQAPEASPQRDLIRRLEDADARAAVDAERAFANHLAADCNTPVAALAQIQDGSLELVGAVLSPDGRQRIRRTRRGMAADSRRIGVGLAQELLEEGANVLLQGSRA